MKELHELLRSQKHDMVGKGLRIPDQGCGAAEQREHGLPADGIAGPPLLPLADDLPIRRRIHVVQPGETLEEIAAQYR